MDEIRWNICFPFLRRFLGILISVLVICLDSHAQSIDLSQCTVPLGMESGEIPDSDITASSSFENGNVGPHIGRIRVENQGGAWCPKTPITAEAEEWIQIDLHKVHVITGSETQGRFGNGVGQEYAESYLISYWRPQLNKWVRYRDHSGNEILKGNINTYLASKIELNPPIIASKIRILPYSPHRRTVCMRVEIYGCPFRGGLLSYTIPQGSKRGENWEFYDHTYDGIWDGHNLLHGGFGQLTDGRGGPADFKDDFYGPERGKGWVGWKNDTRNSTNPLEIIFNFDSIREFNAVNIHVSNQFTKDIQVFSEARIYFSVGGKLYPGEPILYVSMEDCIFEDPKNISIKLHHRIGQYVKIQLFWAAKWILISEINFDSQPAMGNFTEEGVTVNVNNNVSVNVNASRKETFKAQNDASRAVIEQQIPINIPNSILDHTSSTMVEDFTSTTIVMTAVISSFIAIILVLLLILGAFLVRHRFIAHHEKIPPSSQPGSLHYGRVSFNSLGQQAEFGYATPALILAHRDSKVGGGQSLSRDFEQRSFSSFVGSNGNMNTNTNSSTGGGGGGGSGCGTGKMKNKTEYYSCAPVHVPTAPVLLSSSQDSGANEYEYVMPKSEFTVGVIGGQMSPRKVIQSNHSPQGLNRCRTIQLRFRDLGLPEISKRRLRPIRKLGDGVFGTVYIGELEVSNSPVVDRRLVAVKHLLRNATEKDKLDFLEEVRLLSSLNDPNVTQVLGVSSEEEPYSVVLEFLELGDLCQFLRQNDTLHPNSSRKLSLGGLLHLAGQIASGMKFLECRNIVHRDLAARNCVVSRSLTVKISHFATDTDLYSSDYYRLDGKMPLPIRWMAWESLFLGKYSTKSDIWSFGVTLWEILTYCQQSPYPGSTDQEVIHNLRRLSILDDSDPFEPLEKPFNCPRDIYELLCDTWRRNDEERPSFWEIHCFLMRKNLNLSSHFLTSTKGGSGSASSSYVEHYIV